MVTIGYTWLQVATIGYQAMTSLYRTVNLIIKQFDSLVKVTLALIYCAHFGITWNMERINTYTST